MTAGGQPAPGRTPLGGLRRALGLLAGWAVLLVASPGMISSDGSLLLAVLGVGLVGAVQVCPLRPDRRRRDLLVEWAAGGVGLAASMWWIVFVVPPGLAYVAAGFGVYVALAGWLARRLARRWSVGVAVALAWWGAETLRTVLPPPFGLGWLRLGHYAHAHLALSGSARVFGVEGLTLVVAALGGLLAQLLVRRRLERGPLLLAGGSLAVALVAAAASAPPPTVAGPRVLVVQPAIEQEAKQFGSREDLFVHLRRLTHAALAEATEDGEPPDLVAWGETMLQLPFAEPAVREALGQGLLPPPWRTAPDLAQLDHWRRIEAALVERSLLGRFPPGTAFLTGAEVFDVVGDTIRRRNAALLFDRDGTRGPAAAKRFLVPGAETMHGLERFGSVRRLFQESIGYLPDFVAARETGVLTLPAGPSRPRPSRIGVSICFDNAFAAPFTDPVRAGPLDFHVVLTNEAWYRDSCELDQMVAFSRLAAISTGRAVLRVANSGVTCLLGPDGDELRRLRVGGRDRSVAGTLAVRVPVPEDPEAGGPPYVTLRGPLRWGIGIFFLVLWGLTRGGGPGMGYPDPGVG